MPSERELAAERRRCLIRDLLRRTDRNGIAWARALRSRLESLARHP
jgi:hypothetical protein